MTKELLSEILGLHIYSFEYNSKSNKLLFSFDAIGEMRESEINIYELAYKCKEWAYKLNKFVIHSGLSDGYGFARIFGKYNCAEDDPENVFTALTEPEAIFNATQWMLEGMKNEISVLNKRWKTQTH